jgi:hypothetical protein
MKPPIYILLVFLVFYHIPPPLLQIDKILEIFNYKLLNFFIIFIIILIRVNS